MTDRVIKGIFATGGLVTGGLITFLFRGVTIKKIVAENIRREEESKLAQIRIESLGEEVRTLESKVNLLAEKHSPTPEVSDNKQS